MLQRSIYTLQKHCIRLSAEKNPAIEFNPLVSSDKREIASNFPLFLIRFVIFRQILDAEMKDGSWHWFESKTKRKSQTLMKKKGSGSKVEYLEWRLRAKLGAKACRS